MADAIIRATDAGCHVISISMGGLPLDYLERALHYAVSNGVIVCCAAGNIFGANDVLHAVVWPAHYPDALAVAASNANDQPWSGSSRGPEVDITAPGESVWHAIAKKGKPLTEVARGDGTSFAVATTAGVAALWLAYHDRERLISLYGRERIPGIFKHIVMTFGFRTIPNWNTSLFGPGIIDALQVLQAPLPAVAVLPSSKPARNLRQSSIKSPASLTICRARSYVEAWLNYLIHRSRFCPNVSMRLETSSYSIFTATGSCDRIFGRKPSRANRWRQKQEALRQRKRCGCNRRKRSRQ